MSQYRRNYESVLIDERNTFNRFARIPMSGLTSRVVLSILLSRSLNICSGRSNGNVGGQVGDAISWGERWHGGGGDRPFRGGGDRLLSSVAGGGDRPFRWDGTPRDIFEIYLRQF